MSTLFTMRPEIPKKFIDTKRLERAFQKAMDIAIDKAMKEFLRTVATWDGPPTFTVRKTTWQRSISTTDKRFNILDEGARPHQIVPRSRGVGFLQFQTSYKPKTVPNVIDSFPGGASGPYRRPSVVHHPGVKARNFSERISETMQETLEKEVELAILQELGRIQF